MTSFIRTVGESMNLTIAAYFEDGRTVEHAAEIGLDFVGFYALGRCGVLGEVDGAVAASAQFFIEPKLVADVWAATCAKVDPKHGASRFAKSLWTFGRERFADIDVLPQFCSLAERVASAADARGQSLFAGWRQMPLPADPQGRAMQLMHVLRELRGGAHGIAARVAGLSAVEAIMAKDGEGIARLFGWEGELPDPAPLQARHARAEDITDELVAPAFEVLGPSERVLFRRVAEACQSRAGALDVETLRQRATALRTASASVAGPR